MRAALHVSDDATVETVVTAAVVAQLVIHEGNRRLRILAHDPVVWRRIAAAAGNLAVEQEAALRPPPHRDLGGAG